MSNAPDAPAQELGWKRSDYVISTKLFWGGKGVNDRGLSRKHLVEGIKARWPLSSCTLGVARCVSGPIILSDWHPGKRTLASSPCLTHSAGTTRQQQWP
jgi:hypothetical protein